jgi:exonuclease VII small subunit
MEGFENVESFEEFKHRLNSLTEKLNKTSKNLNQALGE